MSRPNPFVRRALLGAALALPAAADAQIFQVRRPSGEPQLWAAVGVGLFDSQSVIDGTTQSEWRLSDATQYRASLEYAMRGGNSLGVVVTHARPEFRFVGVGCPPPGGAGAVPCGEYNAEMAINSAWGIFHAGGGEGFHGVFEGGLGYTWYRDFKEDDGDEGNIAGLETDRDFSFFFGTGFGFGITRRLSVNLVQDFVFVRHQGEGLSGDDRTTTQQRVTRFGVRYGVGSRRAGI